MFLSTDFQYQILELSDLLGAQSRPSFSDQNLLQKTVCNSYRTPKLLDFETTSPETIVECQIYVRE